MTLSNSSKLTAIFLLISTLAWANPTPPPLTVTEEDGSPSAIPVYTIKFANGTVTDNGDTTVSVSGGAGETNTTSNSGTGNQIALPKVGVDFPFRSVVSGDNVTIATNANDITINVSSVPSEDVTGVFDIGNTNLVGGTNVDLTGSTISVATFPSEDVTGVFEIDSDTNLTAGTNVTLTGAVVSVATFPSEDVTGVFEIDSDTNLTAGTNVTLTGSTVSVPLSGSTYDILWNNGGAFSSGSGAVTDGNTYIRVTDKGTSGGGAVRISRSTGSYGQTAKLYFETAESVKMSLGLDSSSDAQLAFEDASGNNLMNIVDGGSVGNVAVTGALTSVTLDTGQGAYELYAMNQDVENTDAVTFATVDTGQGANELFDMDQNVLTTSNVVFPTVNTGQGLNELYAMNQAVTTSNDVVFVDVSTDTVSVKTGSNIIGIAAPALSSDTTIYLPATLPGANGLILRGDTDGTTNWIPIPAGGGSGSLEFVSTVAISNDATIDVTNIASGYDYMFNFEVVVPVTDTQPLCARTSTDNGVSYDSGANDYSFINGATGDHILLSGNAGNQAGEGVSCEILLVNPGNITHTHLYVTGGVRVSDTNAVAAISNGGKRESAADVDAVQFFFTSGNLNTGNITVWRRKRS